MKEIKECFSRIQRALRSDMNLAMQGTCLHPSEVQALRHITFHKIMSQKELAEDMGVDKATVTRIVAQLEEKQLVQRVADPADGRVKRIVPTQAAREIRDRAIQAENGFYHWLLEDLSPAEYDQFQQTLEHLLERCRGKRLHQPEDTNPCI